MAPCEPAKFESELKITVFCGWSGLSRLQSRLSSRLSCMTLIQKVKHNAATNGGMAGESACLVCFQSSTTGLHVHPLP